jgi:hypothetical protein
MARIEKKIWPEYFAKILSGAKKWELRLADFECRTGDVLVLREWDPKKKDYTGRSIEKAVTDVFKTNYQKFWRQEDVDKFGYQIISFK